MKPETAGVDGQGSGASADCCAGGRISAPAGAAETAAAAVEADKRADASGRGEFVLSIPTPAAWKYWTGAAPPLTPFLSSLALPPHDDLAPLPLTPAPSMPGLASPALATPCLRPPHFRPGPIGAAALAWTAPTLRCSAPAMAGAFGPAMAGAFGPAMAGALARPPLAHEVSAEGPGPAAAASDFGAGAPQRWPHLAPADLYPERPARAEAPAFPPYPRPPTRSWPPTPHAQDGGACDWHESLPSTASGPHTLSSAASVPRNEGAPEGSGAAGGLGAAVGSGGGGAARGPADARKALSRAERKASDLGDIAASVDARCARLAAALKGALAQVVLYPRIARSGDAEAPRSGDAEAPAGPHAAGPDDAQDTANAVVDAVAAAVTPVADHLPAGCEATEAFLSTCRDPHLHHAFYESEHLAMTLQIDAHMADLRQFVLAQVRRYRHRLCNNCRRSMRWQGGAFDPDLVPLTHFQLRVQPRLAARAAAAGGAPPEPATLSPGVGSPRASTATTPVGPAGEDRDPVLECEPHPSPAAPLSPFRAAPAQHVRPLAESSAGTLGHAGVAEPANAANGGALASVNPWLRAAPRGRENEANAASLAPAKRRKPKSATSGLTKTKRLKKHSHLTLV
jgi:hypothetical protein